ncbi:MAG: GNVR domain-containing protein, partial [Leadbetterella sp.]
LESEFVKNRNDVKDKENKYPKSENYIVLDRQTAAFIKILAQRISGNYDKKTGVISITVKMRDPVLAAGITNFAMKYLTNYIVEYRTGKLKNDLDFIGERLALAKGKYFNNQERKASYSDRVPLEALRFQTSDLQRERIDAEYKTSSTFYTTLLQKYEETKLKVQQETPVIKVLEPPVVPLNKSEPKRSIIIFIYVLLSAVLFFIYALCRNQNYKNVFDKKSLT